MKVSGAIGAEVYIYTSGTTYKSSERSAAFAENFYEDDNCLAWESRAENGRLAFCSLGTLWCVGPHRYRGIWGLNMIDCFWTRIISRQSFRFAAIYYSLGPVIDRILNPTNTAPSTSMLDDPRFSP